MLTPIYVGSNNNTLVILENYLVGVPTANASVLHVVQAPLGLLPQPYPYSIYLCGYWAQHPTTVFGFEQYCSCSKCHRLRQVALQVKAVWVLAARFFTKQNQASHDHRNATTISGAVLRLARSIFRAGQL